MAKPYGAGPYYDLMLARGRERIAFLATRLRRFHRLLDVGAGNGELALALARRGHEVICLEPSRAMFGVLLARLPAQGTAARRITPLCRSIGSRLSLRVDAAYCCNVLHLIRSEAARRRFLRAIFRCLPPGGLLVFDFVPRLAPRTQARNLLATGRFGAVTYCHWTATRRRRNDYHIVDWTVEGRQGRRLVDRYTESFHVRSDSAAYWERTVAACGGVVLAQLSGYPGPAQRVQSGSNRGVILARKRLQAGSPPR